ncbi:autotransporter outer membrane beta-barrel domain-containing protein, partial [Chelatococcus reniformis]
MTNVLASRRARRLEIGAGRAGLLSSASLAALLAAAPAFAQSANCSTPSSSHASCTIGSGTYTSSSPLQGEGDGSGDRGPDYTLTNNGTFSISSSQWWGLYLTSTGHDGSSSDADGGDGGNLVVTNNGSIAIGGTSSDAIYGLYVRSHGGDGKEPDDNGADGGRGGDGGHIGDGASGDAALAVKVVNNGSVSITQRLPDGGVGIFAEARAGQGGDQNDAITGNQKGGNSGDAKDISLTNAGDVNLGSAGSFLAGNSFAYGIAAQSRGNEGGDDNGAGGTGGNITIGNTGTVGVYWNGGDGTPGGVRGIYALSSGGDGTDSEDPSDGGGKGEAGYQVQVTSSGNITVQSQSPVAGLSGGIVAISQGGDGGKGPNSNKGGNGGNAGDTSGGGSGLTSILLQGSGVVSAVGDNVAGVVVRSKGGAGGDGEDGDRNSSGGNGGDGGAVQVTMLDSASIATNGAAGYGVLGQSVGGSGGDGGDNTALVGQTGGGGYGGNGGSVSFGSTSDTTITTITTHGNFSSAIALHSIGGGGGTGGDFVAILGGSGGNGGNGGDGGAVSVGSSGLIQTYGAVSHGILAQSVAGSGGTGDIPVGVILELGGDGGSGGNGGAVDVSNFGTILTRGFGSRGIVAQSISGGGGDAGTLGGGKLTIGGSAGGGGDAGDVTVVHSGAMQTGGDAATGILAQSIGGGGGSGAGTFGIISVGSDGGAGGNGGNVDVGLAGSVVTSGAWANGVTAQSIGAGGGDGGNTLDFSVLIPAVGVGGSGGSAGNGNDVRVGNIDPASGAGTGTPYIATSGEHAYGILAQSIGGGGGSGGNAIGAGVLNFLSLQIGGDSSGGGDGNDVRVGFKNLTILTQNSDSIGIAAQSIGGGGGVGGSAYAADANLVFSSGVALGGKGGGGGAADTVTVDLTDSAITTGQSSDPAAEISDSIGVLAQSVGGGGGTGGRAMAAAIAQSIPVYVPVSLTATVSVGGSGGGGGNGDNVDVNLRGNTSVSTYGDGSHGIVAQSIGGGGGYAKNAWTYAMTSGLGAGVFGGDLSVAVGGDGGEGGNGAQANVNLYDQAAVTTTGNQAHAILAQSIGGGGGNGGVAKAKASGSFGFSALTGKIGVGGFGGGGGDGGDTTVTAGVDTQIATSGATSYGIVAQSIGGGGGTSTGMSAGFTEKVGFGETITVSISDTVTVGLTGGEGGKGGTTKVTTAGQLATTGAGSIGVVAQSIGGGGGIGGSVVGNAIAGSNILSALDIIWQNYDFTVSIGGSGGQGGDGGEVEVTHAGTISTQGHHAIGLLAQSIGGGGGLGGTSTISDAKTTASLNEVVGGSGGDGGRGGAVTANFDSNNNNRIETAGRLAHGVVLQSIGGGGGMAGDGSTSASGRLVIGATGGGASGDGNRGGTVSATGWLNAYTHGTDAMGLVAQSIGGGGGIGSQSASNDIDNQLGVALNLVVGGSGGAGGDGGDVSIASGFNLATDGKRAHAIVAQSIGGGGGMATVGDRGNILSLALGGAGGVGGDGGTVNVAPTAGTYITTTGAGAYGIIAQSIGGGGGLGGDTSGPLAFDRPGAGGVSHGGGGTVGVSFDGTIQVSGTNAIGVFAQSVGGGGGLGGDAGGAFAGSTGNGGSGTGGNVTVNQSGAVYALGSGGVGIFAQSQGPSGNGQVQVDVAGTVKGASDGSGAGVLVSAGRNNALTVQSSGYVSGNGGAAVRYVGDRSTAAGSVLDVYNYGTIDGDVLLNNTDSNAAGTVYNYSNNTLNARLVEGNVVNTGTVVIGGRDTVGTTRITGNFAQSRDGTLRLDADFGAGRIDHLSVAGNAELDGRVDVRTGNLLPRRLAFLDVGGIASGTLTGISRNVFDFNVAREGNSYTLAVDATFNRPEFGLGGGDGQVAGHLQQIWNAGGGAFGPVFAALAAADLGAYTGVLGALRSETINAPAAENVALTQQRLDRAMSCPVFQTGTASLREGECLWGQAGGQRFNQGRFDGAGGYNDTVYTYALGGQKRIAPNWFLGFAAAYEDSRIADATGSRVKIDGQSGSAGLSLKYEIGNWLFAAAVSGNYGSFDSTRIASFAGIGGVAFGTQNLYGLGGRLRAAYTWDLGGFYVRPFVDADLVYTNAGSYNEIGAGLFDRQVA